MKLETAIEINTINNDHNPNYTDSERHQAHQLGIEALKVITAIRERNIVNIHKLLPGETE